MTVTVDVSFVVPTYNSAETIAAALDSIRVQTCQPREVIVVDDASTDNTCAVVTQQQATLPQLRLVRMQSNGGPAASRNRGVAEAAGEWIAFLDADDLCVPDRIAAQLECSEAHPDTALICGEAHRIIDDAATAPHRGEDPATSRELTLADFVENNQVATSTVMVKRSVMKRVGGFDEQFRGPEDLDLWLRIAAVCPLQMMNVPLALYRYVPGSLSMDPDRFLPEVLRVLKKAFSPGGALAAHPEWRRAAESTQVWNAAWMAFVQGRRGRAVAHWLHAFALHAASSRRTRRKWFRILIRYVAGRRPQQARTG